MNMEYQKIIPPPSLRDHVRYFWTLESAPGDDIPRTFKTLADGSPGLIFQHSDQGNFYQFDKKLPSVFLYGQTTRHTDIYSPAQFRTTGIYFYPHALQSVFGMNATELTDTCVDVGEMGQQQGISLPQQLLDTASQQHQVEILSGYLSNLLRINDPQADKFFPYVLSKMIESKGNISLKALQEELCMTERSFERKFRQAVGMPPKLFTRICRFQASLSQLRNGQFDKLSDIAFENDYADQSHFIRAFKEFAGFSPNKYQEQSNEIVESFPELIR